MVEVVFSESMAGSLKYAVAMAKGSVLGSAVSVCGLGEKPSDEEAQRLQKEAEQREKALWEGAISPAGKSGDILAFPLLFSVGDIGEKGIGQGRENALRSVWKVYPHMEKEAETYMERIRKNLHRLMERAGAGEAVRIWTDKEPDTACGLRWLMMEMEPLGLDKGEIWQAELPAFEQCSDGCIVEYNGWGDVEPARLGELAQRAVRLPANRCRALAAEWKQLMAENAPLRAVLNGRLVSVEEGIYDGFIRRAAAEQPREFLQAQVVGLVLGRYRLGIGDGWIALRMEKMIEAGELEAVTKPDADEPLYHRMLRKTEKFSTKV